MVGALTCKVSRKYSNAFLSYSAKTKRDGRTDRRTGGVAISPVPGPTAPAGDKNLPGVLTRKENMKLKNKNISFCLLFRSFLDDKSGISKHCRENPFFLLSQHEVGVWRANYSCHKGQVRQVFFSFSF